MKEIVKGCHNCAYRHGDLRFCQCTRAGTYMSVEREFQSQCDNNFSGWALREDSMLEKFLKWLVK